MATRRRWLQFSLRSFFVVLTAFAVWLGWKVERLREQREAVKAIEAMGGWVLYDWEVRDQANLLRPGRSGMLRRLVGEDCVQEVEIVILSELSPPEDLRILQLIPSLQRMRGLKSVSLSLSSTKNKEVEAALPNCKIHRIDPLPRAVRLKAWRSQLTDPG